MSYKHSLWLWAAVMAWQGSLAWASEAEQNRATARACKSEASRHDDGDAQTTTLCRNAVYHQCLARVLCESYPDSCGRLRAVVTDSCAAVDGLNRYARQAVHCPACE